jgi:hypothetical protein
MKLVEMLSRPLLISSVAFGFMACDDGHLRGSVEPSNDGETYLVIAEGNNCDQILIDGIQWPHAIGESGALVPGDHVIDCNGEIAFAIPAGTTFTFDYWGP